MLIAFIFMSPFAIRWPLGCTDARTYLLPRLSWRSENKLSGKSPVRVSIILIESKISLNLD